MRISAGIVAGAVALIAIASAARAEPFGCQVGVGLGGSIASTDISGVGDLFDINGAGSHSSRPDAGLRGECGFRAGNFYAGAFGEYDWQNVQFSASLGGPAATVALGDSYLLGGRVGYVVGSAMPYVGVAYNHTDLSWSSAFGTGLPTSLTGPTALAGTEFPLTNMPLTLALETRWTHFETTDIGKTTLSMQTDDLSTMVRLNWNFGGPAAATATHVPTK